MIGEEPVDSSAGRVTIPDERLARARLPDVLRRLDPERSTSEPWAVQTPLIPRSDVRAIVPLGAGGGAFRVDLLDGSRVLYKPRGSQRMVRRPYIPRERAHLREIGAYVVSHLTGLHIVPPTILGRVELGPDDWPLGALQAWVDGQQPIETPPDRLAPIAAIDYLVGNTDRHRGNLIEDDQGRLWAIDHTASFPDLVGSPRDGFRGEGRGTNENRIAEEPWEGRSLPEDVLAPLRETDPLLLWHSLLELRLESEASGAARDRLIQLQQHGRIPRFSSSLAKRLWSSLRGLNR